VLRPFVTTKANGTGLGLGVVTRAVEQHRGRFALATREGGGTVAASRFEAAGGEGSIVIEVRDRGCGIPPEQLEEVLRPFVTTKANGTGLGLVVVTRAVEQHRGRFALATREGGGTVAAIRFPVRRAAPDAPPAGTPAPAAPAPAATPRIEEAGE
jgi:nitrogen fixation/metabolism regulation signal transduction histidine kinase